MEVNEKLIFGKILGEIYRLQKNAGIYKVSEGHIFGLLNGFEEEIERAIDGMQLIPNWKVNLVRDALEPYYLGKKPLEKIDSISFRLELERQGVSEADFYTILKFLRANNSYTVEIDKLGNYKLGEYDI